MSTQQIAKFCLTLAAALLNNSAYADSTELKKQLTSLTNVAAELTATSAALQGQQIYESHCLPCHTANSPLTPIAQSPLLLEASSELVKFILFSKNGSKHPAWHIILSPMDVANLSTYIEGQFKQSRIELVSPEHVVSVIAAKYRGSSSECGQPKAKQSNE